MTGIKQKAPSTTGGYSYSHSDVFARMKNLTERLPTNLTTSQYLQTLDQYLLRSITPIINGTRFLDGFLARLVGWQEKNFRRKVTFENRRVVPAKIITFLLQPSDEGRLKAFVDLLLDRGVVFEAIALFYERTALYVAASDCELSRPGHVGVDLPYCLFVRESVETEMRATVSLTAVLSESRYWADCAVAFKQLILEKYTRLCLNTAQADYVSYFKHSVPLGDIVHWYWISASRAIDKCDSNQGALTSHIAKWFLTARAKVLSQKDQQTNELNLETFIHDSHHHTEHISLEDQEEAAARLENMRHLAALADPIGVARAYLGIENPAYALEPNDQLSRNNQNVNNRIL